MSTDRLLTVIAAGDPIDVVAAYRGALYADGVNWSIVNHAIIDRWSMRKLRTIKELAWDRDWPLSDREFAA